MLILIFCCFYFDCTILLKNIIKQSIFIHIFKCGNAQVNKIIESNNPLYNFFYFFNTDAGFYILHKKIQNTPVALFIYLLSLNTHILIGIRYFRLSTTLSVQQKFIT